MIFPAPALSTFTSQLLGSVSEVLPSFICLSTFIFTSMDSVIPIFYGLSFVLDLNISVLKLYQIQPAEIPLMWLLYPYEMSLIISFFKHLFTF